MRRRLRRRYGRARNSPAVVLRDERVPQIAAVLRDFGFASPNSNAGRLYDQVYSVDDVRRLIRAGGLQSLGVFKAAA